MDTEMSQAPLTPSCNSHTSSGKQERLNAQNLLEARRGPNLDNVFQYLKQGI